MMQSLRDFWAFCKAIPLMPPGTKFAPPRLDLMVSDLRKAAGQFKDDGFSDPIGMIGLFFFLVIYMILPVLILTDMLF